MTTKTMTHDYVRDAWEAQDHIRRLRARVLGSRHLICQECLGRGEITEDILDGLRRNETCSLCHGIGLVLPRTRGLWLNWRRDLRREGRI